MRGPVTVEDHFDGIFRGKKRIEYDVDLQRAGLKDRKIARFLQECGVRGSRCLDVGPGTGRWLTFLKQQGASYLAAIDVSGESLERCAPLCDRTQKADVETERFAFDTDSFDIVISIEVLEHLGNPDGYLSEIRRVSKNGGSILMSTPNLASFISRYGCSWVSSQSRLCPIQRTSGSTGRMISGDS